ncbi:MAG: hypothetical protein V1837_01885 [Candidatus Woesearchaeota archaeon]
MYKEFETRISYKYLKEVINTLEEPICILGGWAVFFHVNNRFEKAQGRPYLGSRDIDLGFQMKTNLKETTLAQTIRILKEELKFKPLSFRLMKEIHTETEEELKEGETVSTHFIFPMYVDLIVDSIPDNFKNIFGFNPIDEPLLKQVFENKESTMVTEFNRKLLLPTPKLLLGMKVNSLPNRDKDHKRIKDICDMFALLWYTDIKAEKVNLGDYASKKAIIKAVQTINNQDYEKVAAQIGHSAEEIKRVISLLLQ